MDRDQLRALSERARHTLREVEEREPALAGALRREAGRALRERLVAALQDAPGELRERVAGLDLSGVGDVVAAVRASLESSSLDRALIAVWGARLEGARDTLADPLGPPDAVLADLPLVRRLLERAQVHRVGELAGLDEAQVEAVLAGAPSLVDIDDAVLAGLVARGVMDEGTAKSFGLAASLFLLVDRDSALTAAIKHGRAEHLRQRVPAGQVTSLRQLAALSAGDWRAILEQAGIAQPAGISAAARAARLADRLAVLFPCNALLGRLPAGRARGTACHLERMAPLVATGVPITAAGPGDIEAAAGSRDRAREMRRSQAALVRLANAYPGMNLGGIIDDPALAASTKAQRIAGRVALLGRVVERHADVELLALDYAPGGPRGALDLDGMGLSADEQRMVLGCLEAYQRVYALTEHADTARALVEAGFDSAAAVATTPLAEVRARLDAVDEAAVRRIYDRARASLDTTALCATALLALHPQVTGTGGFANLGASNLDPAIGAYLDRVPGMAALVAGPADSRCDHCRSLLAPAAYFVDLMAFVDEHVDAGQGRGAPGGGEGGLDARRPDLWTLPLTCETAWERVPTLDIANEVLERYVAARSAPPDVLDEREDIERVVYGECLATAVEARCRPFSLPLERLCIYLEEMGESREHVARVLGAAPPVIAAAALGLSEPGLDLLVEPEFDVAGLGAIYGMNFQVAHGVIEPVDVQRLLCSMAVSRAELDDLMATAFVSAAGSAARVRFDSAPGHGRPGERVHDLTADVLDRMHRFARLWRALPWSIRELDLVLDKLGRDELSAAALGDVVTVREVQARLGLQVEDVCALWGNLPRVAAQGGRPPVFDRVFNAPLFVRQGGALPQSHTHFVHPAFRAGEAGEQADAIHARLLAGLRTSDEELHSLIVHLADPLGVALDTADDSDRGVALTAGNLSLLYRHAALARSLGLSIPGLFRLIALTEGMSSRGHVATLADLVAVIHHHQWWQGSGFSLDAIAFIVGAAGSGSLPAIAHRGAGITAPGAPEASAGEPPAERVAAAFGIGADKARALLAMAGCDPDDPALVQAARGRGPDQPLRDAVAAIAPLTVLFADPVFDAAALAFIHAHRALFGITCFTSLSVHDVKSVVLYARAVERAKGCGSATPVADVHAALVAFEPVSGFTAAATEPLARVLCASPGLVSTLRGHLSLPATAPGALATLARAVSLAQRLGVSGDTLIRIAARDHASLAHAADVVYGALCARHAGDAERERVIESCAARLRARKRDGLVAYIGHLLPPRGTGDGPWSDRDLADYFLLDLDATGRARTTRIMAAIASVQRYVQRCFTGLEADSRALPGPGARAEWTWRASYGAWRARREVFLFPENHLEPALRGEKTPLYDQLDAALRDPDLDDQKARDAYVAYIDGFEQVADLGIAGVYHHIRRDGSGDVLHIIGVTGGDPPVHYHRAVAGARFGETDVLRGPVWSPWRAIDVPIPARHVAPVVCRDRLYLVWMEAAAPGAQPGLGITRLRLDGTWTAPQHIPLPARPAGDRVVVDPPGGAGGDELLGVTDPYLSFHAGVDLVRREARARPLRGAAPPPEVPLLAARGHTLYHGVPAHQYDGRNGFANLLIADEHIARFVRDRVPELITAGLYRRPIARLGPGDRVTAVSGSVEDAVIEAGRDSFLLQASVRPGARYLLRRVGTTLAETVTRTLCTGGVDSLLDVRTQRRMGEAGLPFTRVGTRIEDASNRGRLDLRGPYGAYFREIFFHAPLLIARRLSARQRFAAARRWYRYVFDPEAAATADLPPCALPAGGERRTRDRVWRYIEHRDLDATRLREVVTDHAAIEAHRARPLDAHAIARLRLGAYQTHVVMSYLDTLIAWGDRVCREGTAEALHDAAMLYRQAADILGPRPPERGRCDPPPDARLTYERIKPRLGRGIELVAALETLLIGSHRKLRGTSSRLKTRFLLEWAVMSSALRDARAQAATPAAPGGRGSAERLPAFGWSVIRQIAGGMYLPPNQALVAYWDCIEDRLRGLREAPGGDGEG